MMTSNVIPAADLRAGDVILGGNERYPVLAIHRRGQMVRIKCFERTWTVPAHYRVSVVQEEECDSCKDGTWYGAGYVENGVFKGLTGPCYRCRGTGRQNRADRNRNHVYDRHMKIPI